MIIGGFSGYFGGWFDSIVQRLIEILRSIPTIPLWMGLSAALPPHWPQVRVYFGITIILSLIGWTQLARVVREPVSVAQGRRLPSRGAAVWSKQVPHCGPPHGAVVFELHHRLHYAGDSQHDSGGNKPQFLGVGAAGSRDQLGVLLQEAQNVRTIALSPWLLLPGVMVFITVLAFNFFGDGLRDAADPYAR